MTHFESMQRLAFASACVSAVALCPSCKSGADVVQEYRPRAEAKLDAMRKATRAALDEPVTRAPDLPEKLRYGGDAPNAYLVHPEWLEVPARPSERDILIPAGQFTTVRGLVSGSKSPTGVVEYYEKTFEGFLGVRWLVVVENDSFDSGVATSDASFLGGGWKGTLHFVDLEQGGSVGSLQVESSHSDEVEVIEGDEETHLSADVWGHARRAISDALAPLCAADQEPL